MKKIPDLTQCTPNNPPLLGSHAADGMIGSVSQKAKNNFFFCKNVQVLALSDSLDEDPSLEITSEINAIDLSTGKGKSFKNNINGKGKTKPYNCSKEKLSKNKSFNEKRKDRYPCLICEEDCYTKECPYWAEVSKFVKNSPTVVV